MAYPDFWKVLLFLWKVRSHLEILFNRKFQIFRKCYSLLEKLVNRICLEILFNGKSHDHEADYVSVTEMKDLDLILSTI